MPALATVTFVYALVAAAAAAGRKSKVVGRKLVKKMFTAENILHRKVFIHTPYVLTALLKVCISCGQVVRDFEREAKTRCNF